MFRSVDAIARESRVKRSLNMLPDMVSQLAKPVSSGGGGAMRLRTGLQREKSMSRQTKRLSVPFILALLVLSATSAPASERNDRLKALLGELTRTYKITKTGMDEVRITEPGTVLVVKKDGIGANPTFNESPLAYTVSGGEIKAPKGFAAALLSSGPTSSTTLFKPGEKVYVTNLSVGDATVSFTLLSYDMSSIAVRGNTRQTRYIAHLQFQLPAGVSQPPTAAEIKAVVDPILALEGEATAPKTIEMGQTPEDVEGALGKPEKIFKAGSKVIYTYKDVKVIFTDGKVTDVQ
jgi:hypothetical protein